MIYVWVGAVSWLGTWAILLRYVTQPWLSRRVVLTRFRQSPPSSRTRVPSVTGTVRRLLRRQGDEHRPMCEHIADWLDAIGRELRLGSSLHAALVAAIQRHGIDQFSWLGQISRNGVALETSIAAYLDENPPARRPSEDEVHRNFALRALIAASRGADAVHAVESAARSLRGSAAISADARAAVTYTKTSVAVLTLIPLVVVSWLVLRDEDVRRFLTTAPGMVCLTVGVFLNALGRWLVQRIATDAMRSHSELSEFIDLVTVHLRSANPPALAFMNASADAVGEIGAAARQVVASMNDGLRFVEALAVHRSRFDARAHVLIDALVDTERDGLSPRDLFTRLSSDAQAERRRSSDRRIRALPVRLSLPLVGCILPAYVLLAVIPLLAGQISSVVIDPR